MTLRIEGASVQGRMVLRLIGRVEAECLPEIVAHFEGTEPPPALDLGEVTLVDVETVRFFNACEQSGIELLRCAQYIRQWMAAERPR